MMMQIRIMWMDVTHRLMAMPVRMRPAVRGLVRARMGVLMMRVMHMAMLMFERLMRMLMDMVFAQMKPKAQAH